MSSHIGENGSKRSSNKRGRNSPTPSREGVADQEKIPSHTSKVGVNGINGSENEEMCDSPQSNSFFFMTNDSAVKTEISRETNNLPVFEAGANRNSQQDSIDDVLVNYLVSANLPVDHIKDSSFRSLLTRVAQDGVPSFFNQRDRVCLQKSLWNWEYEVNEYMLAVKDSWKKSDCTYITYNLDLGNGKLKNTLVHGFYCPKGFIFVEGGHLDHINGIKYELRTHGRYVDCSDDVTWHMRHSKDRKCELLYSPKQVFFTAATKCTCFKNEIQCLWYEICLKSAWVGELIKQSETLYKFLSFPSLYTNWVQEEMEKHRDDMPMMSSFVHLRLFMELKDKIKTRIPHGPHAVEDVVLVAPCSDYEWLVVRDIINSDEFWNNGKELIKALNPLMNVVDLVDTLCPVFGYIIFEMERARSKFKFFYDQNASKYLEIWNCIQTCFSDLDIYLETQAAYLNPMYEVGDEAHDRDLAMESMVDIYPELEKEVNSYEAYNPFKKVPDFLRKQDHSVKLWEKYGSKFPKLKEHAIRLLSKSGSCMCNQIKKKMAQIQGTDNVIKRLNYKMMEEFIKLGDSIYKPPPKLLM